MRRHFKTSGPYSERRRILKELKARVTVKFKDDPAAYGNLLKVINLAMEIADMDEKQSKKYQKSFWEI